MTLEKNLLAVFDEFGDHLPEYAWASENDRWREFVFCLLQRCAGESAENARQATTILGGLGLADLGTLAHLSDSPMADYVAKTLELCGFTAQQAKTSTHVLQAVAQALHASADKKLQRLVRRHAELIRGEMVDMFRDAGLEPAAMREAVSQWLQNGFSLPVSLETKAVRAFCKNNKVSMPELAAAVDSLELNLAVVDDVLEMKHASSRQSSK